MSEPLPVTQIEVDASVQDNGDQKSLHIWIRGTDLELNRDPGQQLLDVEVDTAIFDSQGKTVNTNLEPLKRPLSPDEAIKLKEKGLEYVARLKLKPGLYHIRIGVRDVSSDRLGTAMAWLEIPKPGRGRPRQKQGDTPENP
jgi:hypothetical protein